jgi:hypothetical protein
MSAFAKDQTGRKLGQYRAICGQCGGTAMTVETLSINGSGLSGQEKQYDPISAVW